MLGDQASCLIEKQPAAVIVSVKSRAERGGLSGGGLGVMMEPSNLSFIV